MGTSGIVALVAIALVGMASGDHRLDRRPRRPQHVGLPRRLAHGRPGGQRQRDLGRVPFGGVVPRRRRADPAGRRRRAVVPDRRSPRATWRWCCSWPRRCAAPARTRCPTSPTPGSTPTACAGCARLRARDRVALPAAPAAGRRPGADHAHGAARLERDRRRGAGRRAHRGRRRHAVDHLRAGVPVLAQAHRAGRARGLRAGLFCRDSRTWTRRAARLPRRDHRRRAHGRRPADRRAGDAGRRRHGRRRPGGRAADLAAGTARGRPARSCVPGGSPVPTVAGAPATDRHGSPGSGDADDQLLAIYSLLIATFLGTMGLPHVLVRFYTNPDGRAARRTTRGGAGADRRCSTCCRRWSGCSRRLYTPAAAAHRARPTPRCCWCPPPRSAGLAGVAARRPGRGGRRGGVPVHVVRAAW